MTDRYWYECRVCGYDSDEARHLADTDRGNCPLCFSDCLHEHPMRYRPATDEEVKKYHG